MMIVKKYVRLVVSFMLLGTALSGCGVKPGEVSPPLEAGDNVYPRSYPSGAK